AEAGGARGAVTRAPSLPHADAVRVHHLRAASEWLCGAGPLSAQCQTPRSLGDARISAHQPALLERGGDPYGLPAALGGREHVWSVDPLLGAGDLGDWPVPG